MIMGRLVVEETGHVQLLSTVLPAFVKALPSRPSPTTVFDPKQEILNNAVTLLRFEVKETQRLWTNSLTEYDLPTAEVSRASKSLENLLYCLEGLVHMDKDCHVQHAAFPKLHILRERIAGCGVTPNLSSTYHSAKDTIETVSHDISYGTKAAEYKRIRLAAENFNASMRAIVDCIAGETESQVPQIFQPQAHTDTIEDGNKAKKEIYQARLSCETTKVMFQLLTEQLGPCQNSHSILIHLNGFDRHEIDTIISLCVDDKSKQKVRKWHQVYWTHQASLKSIKSRESLCWHLKRSRKCKTLLRIDLRKDGSWKATEPTAADRMKRHVEHPATTLEMALNTKQDAKEKRLLKKDKLALAVVIARSLLHLLGSPWLKGEWCAKNIFIAQSMDQASTGRSKPYILRGLTNEAVFEDVGDSMSINRFILDLGVVLWQLLFGLKVEIEKEDKADDDEDDPSWSLFNALNREYSHHQESCLEKPCLDIIANCLNLCSMYELDEDSLRAKMYWDIFTPLRSCLESFNQSQKPAGDLQSDRRNSEAPIVDGTNDFRTGRNPRSASRPESSSRKQTAKTVHKKVSQAAFASSLESELADSDFLSSTGDIKDSGTWLDTFDLLSRRLKTLEREDSPCVRIAILDTGCDTDHEYFDGPGNGQDKRLDGQWVDFVASSDKMVDEDPGKHGTALTALLLRLLPNAKVFVARIAKNTDDLGKAQNRIARAIRFAVEDVWNVDIVSLSFGFTKPSQCIEDAISSAERKKGGKVLFIAAANNQGRNQKEMFPSWCESVVSVRGKDHYGAFISRYNPDTWMQNRGAILYGTISENVPCDWATGKLIKSGCSVATPIVAAIAATFIQFVSSNTAALSDIDNVRDLVRTKRGILSVFRVMTEDQEGNRRHLAPWQLFEFRNGQLSAKMHSIGHALSQLP